MDYTPNNNSPMLTAIDIMTTKVISLRPETAIMEVLDLLLRKQISGAPVVDADGKLIGMLSELDCLRMLAVGEYFEQDHERGPVSDYMTPIGHSIGPSLGIYSIADYFMTHKIRRLPVVTAEGTLLGQLSRRDVLRGIQQMAKLTRASGHSAMRGPKLYLSATDSNPAVIANRLT